jgi:cyanophycin synthetase
MLDYAHNPAAYAQALKVCEMLEHRRLVGIIAMPGDRLNTAIECVGTQCAAVFDRIYIKEDKDLRGRAKGEVGGLFAASITKSGFPRNNFSVAEDEYSALSEAISDSLPGDLIVVFYEKYEHLRKLLEEHGARKTAADDAVLKSIVAAEWRQSFV